MLEDILPTSYPYKIVQSSVVSAENFQCEIRAKINCEKDFLRWIKEFESITNTSWILRNSVSSSEKSRYLFNRNYLCQHSDFRKKKETSKNKNCSASLTVRIKRDTRFVRFKDSFAKDGYMTILKINSMHSHRINIAEVWKWLPRCEESKRIFIDLFNAGMSPAAAINCYQTMLLSESPESLANSRINPPVRWIYRFYKKWQEENFGGLNSESSFNILPTATKMLGPALEELQPHAGLCHAMMQNGGCIRQYCKMGGMNSKIKTFKGQYVEDLHHAEKIYHTILSTCKINYDGYIQSDGFSL